MVHGVELRAAHVVVVVGDGAVELLAVGAVLPLVGLVAVVVVIVTCGGRGGQGTDQRVCEGGSRNKPSMVWRHIQDERQNKCQRDDSRNGHNVEMVLEEEFFKM